MLLPVHPPFRPIAARPIKIAALAPFSRVAVAIPARAIELRTIPTVARKTRTIATAAITCAIVPLPPRLHLAAVAVSKIPSAVAIAKILARPVGEFAVGEPALRALATRLTIATIELRTITAVEFRTVTARLEVPPLAASTVVTVEPRRTRPVAELAIGELPFRALAARCTVAAIELRSVTSLEFRSIPARLEIPLLAPRAIIPVEPCRARAVAIVAARRTIIAVCAKRTLAALTLAKTPLGELLFRPPGSAGAAFASGGPVTPAAGIVVFVFVAGHEGSHSGLSQKACAPAIEPHSHAKPVSTFAEGESY
jgi:hypothetical protein